MPGHPATAAGPDHGKSLEKSELYPSLYQGPDQTKVLPSTPAAPAQIYSPVNNFPTSRANDVYRYIACVSGLLEKSLQKIKKIIKCQYQPLLKSVVRNLFLARGNTSCQVFISSSETSMLCAFFACGKL